LTSYSLFCKKRHFCFYKIQGVSLWHFHVYMYCNLNWFIPLYFSPCYISLLLLVISTGFKILYSFFFFFF
jgi:hypothetical protein